MKAIYNSEQVEVIKMSLRQMLPLAVIKQLKFGSPIFHALFETDKGVSIVTIEVKFSWIKRREGIFSLETQSYEDIDKISESMNEFINRQAVLS